MTISKFYKFFEKKTFKKVKLLNIYQKYKSTIFIEKKKNNLQKIFLSISQKIHNPKVTFSKKKVINTFSVGSIIKYFKIKQVKCIRRSLKGVRVFLNLIALHLKKKYKRTLSVNEFNIIINIIGFNYNFFLLKNLIKFLYKESYNKDQLIMLLNLKISFNKTKNKKVKSIKKRLKKKMISHFLKNIKFNKQYKYTLLYKLRYKYIFNFITY